MSIFNPIQALQSSLQTQVIDETTLKNGISDEAISFHSSYALPSKGSDVSTDSQRVAHLTTDPMTFDLSEFGITSLPANLSQIDSKARMLEVASLSSRNYVSLEPTKTTLANTSVNDKAAMAQDMINLYGSTNNKALAQEGKASFLYENSQLQDLKYSTEKDEALRQVSAQFEALFIQQMLKGMRSATQAMSDQDNPLSQSKDNMFQDMMDNQFATTLSRNGSFGLAESLYAQLSKIQG